MKISCALQKVVAFVVMAGWSGLTHAENICNETVPGNRQVDGIPAYAQCAASSGSVYSNNGIDTRTTSGGTDWVRTQGSGGYQCTEYAHRYLAFRWKIASVPGGNAGSWCANTLPAGLAQTTVPVHGDIIVFAPGSCGASSTSGHVAVVDVVNATTITIVEQNGASRRTCAISCASCFLHVQANNGASNVLSTVPAPGDEVKISVQKVNGSVTIQLSGSLKNGASVRLFDCCGRQMVDLTDRMKNGCAICEIARCPAGAFVVSVRKDNRVFCRKIVLGR